MMGWSIGASTLLVLSLLLFSTASAFNKRLSLAGALDSYNETIKTTFPAALKEQLHILGYQISMYDNSVEQIKVSDGIELFHDRI